MGENIFGIFLGSMTEQFRLTMALMSAPFVPLNLALRTGGIAPLKKALRLPQYFTP